QCDSGGAAWIHVDVMDNHFVPNLTIGPPVVKSLRPFTSKILDVHLMVSEPEKLIEPFIRAGADNITFHIEAAHKPEEIINLIKSADKTAGISLKPGTPLHIIEKYLDSIDLVLIMSVEPGFGGQGYINGSTEKIRELRKLLDKKGLEKVLIEVDGGVKLVNAGEILNAGADILVAGEEVFKAAHPVNVMKQFMHLGSKH
ncbi:MAG: ribulose-phosphate 3-epimerase, partial [Candidatus Neomarinimicrobiota bacterium]